MPDCLIPLKGWYQHTPGAPAVPYTMFFNLRQPAQALVYNHLSKGSTCDPPMLQALLEDLHPGETFVDAGAHIGYYSVAAASVVGPTGLVLAFEPNVDTYAVLGETVSVNPHLRISPYRVALSDHSGQGVFHMALEDDGLSSLTPRSNVMRTLAILNTLDAVLEARSISDVAVLKIDVEGHELAVLQGARLAVQRGVRRIVYEVTVGEGGKALAIWDELDRQGYNSYLIRPWWDVPEWSPRFGSSNYVRLSPRDCRELPTGNVLATRGTVASA